MQKQIVCVNIGIVRSKTFTIPFIRGSKGFDRGLAAGEAIRCDTLIAKLKINAEDNLAIAA